MTTQGFTDEIRALINHAAIGSLSLEDLDLILARISKHTDMPLRPAATHPVADSKLNISSNQVQLGDGTLQSTGLNVDGIILNFPESTIDFQTGVVTGGVILRKGAAFTLPAGVVGQYYRIALVYQALDNQIDTIFSGAAGSVAALENPALLFDSLQYDSLVGWVDLQCTDVAGKYKTAGSAAAVIENDVLGVSRIARFGAGSGEGITGDTSYNVQKLVSDEITIKRGSIILDDNTELMTYDGVELETDLKFNLKTQTNSEGVTSPANSTRYYLYLDRTYLPSAPVPYGDPDRLVFATEYGTDKPFVVLAETPQQLTGERYIPLAALKTDGSGNFTLFSNMARRRHQVASQAVSPLAHTVQQQVVGNIGDAGQIRAAHILDVGSFPFALAGKGYFWNLDDVVDGSGNGINLVNTGSIGFADTDQFGTVTNAAELDGATKYLSSSNAALNPGNVPMAMFGWFKAANWNPTSDQALLSLGSGAADWAAEILIGAGGVKFQMSADGSAIAASQAYNGYFAAGSWHHVAIVHDTVDKEMLGFVDGVQVATVPLTGLYSLGTPLFSIGAKYAGNLYAGSVRDVGFINNQAVNDFDIFKFFSAKVTFDLLQLSDQQWTAKYVRADGQIAHDMDRKWIVDQRDQELYFYLGLEATDQAELKLYDGGQYTYTIPKRGFSRIYRADPSGTFPHRLGSAPAAMAVLHDTNADGNWIPQPTGTHLKGNATDLTFAIGGLTIDATHPVWILASAGQEVLAVPPEEPWLMISSAYTAKAGDRLVADSDSAAFNITLPLNPSVGDPVQIMDHKGTFDTNNVTLLRNGQSIQGIADDMDLNQKDKLYTVVYTGASYGWRVV